MSLVEVVLAVIKILVIVMFLLNAAAIATWADRRQSAMVQDRIGPNRAVVYLPSGVARLIVLLPPSVLGALALLPILRGIQPQLAGELLGITSQAAVFVAWFSLLVLCGSVRRHGAINKAEEALEGIDPRSFFYVGIALHGVVFAATGMVPPEALPMAVKVSGAILAGLLFATGIYTASRVPDGKVPLRLAGTLHSAADAVKMIVKEDFIPKHGDRLLHSLAPLIAMFPALVTMAVVPFGRSLCFGGNPTRAMEWADLARTAPSMTRQFVCPGHAVQLQIVDLNVGILYVFAMAGTGVVGAALAGWSSDNKFALFGGLRAASQMVSYEVAMGFSLVGLFMIYGSVRMLPMVDWQGMYAWGIFVQPFAFFLFLAALAAETKRVPFDQPEGESEIVAGYFLEYSGMKWGMFMTGEYMELITSSMLLVTLFFGGFNLPFLHNDGLSIAIGDTVFYSYRMNHIAVVAISVLAFFGKTILMTWVQIFFRWTLPRFRYDQLMKLGWTKLLPLSIANIMLTGIIVLAIDAAPAGVTKTLKVFADLSQALIALGGIAAVVALIVGLLEPVKRQRFLRSTAARFAAAAGGTKATPQQA